MTLVPQLRGGLWGLGVSSGQLQELLLQAPVRHVCLAAERVPQICRVAWDGGFL